MKKYLLFLLLLAPMVHGQDFAGIVRGAGDRPVELNDHYGTLRPAMLIFQNSDVEIYVPDFTDRGWLYWNAGKFRRTGKYAMQLYFFYTDDHKMALDLVEVDSRNRTVLEHQNNHVAPTVLDLNTDRRPRAKAINNLTAIIQAEVGKYRGETE